MIGKFWQKKKYQLGVDIHGWGFWNRHKSLTLIYGLKTNENNGLSKLENSKFSVWGRERNNNDKHVYVVDK